MYYLREHDDARHGVFMAHLPEIAGRITRRLLTHTLFLAPTLFQSTATKTAMFTIFSGHSLQFIHYRRADERVKELGVTLKSHSPRTTAAPRRECAKLRDDYPNLVL